MKSYLNLRLFLTVTGIALVAGVIASSSIGAQSGPPTLEDLAKRVQVLEERVTILEGRLVPSQSDKEQTSKPEIEITDPKNGAEIGPGPEVIIEGLVRVNDLGNRWPVVAVHPLLTSIMYVQALPVKVDKTAEGYQFRCRAYCGTLTRGIGEKFEIFALLPAKGTLKEADEFDRLPQGVPVSATVVVTRSRK
jgi:hypothetical protein